MTREETRGIIQDGIKALGNQIQFGSGRITEFNSKKAKEYPFAWIESLSVNTTINNQGAYKDAWDVKIHIAKKDQPDSIETEYEAIIDDCDYIGQQLTRQYADILDNSQFAKLVSLESTTRTPFIHKHADDTTGIILSFTLIAPDTTNLCNP